MITIHEGAAAAVIMGVLSLGVRCQIRNDGAARLVIEWTARPAPLSRT